VNCGLRFLPNDFYQKTFGFPCKFVIKNEKSHATVARSIFDIFELNRFLVLWYLLCVVRPLSLRCCCLHRRRCCHIADADAAVAAAAAEVQ